MGSGHAQWKGVYSEAISSIGKNREAGFFITGNSYMNRRQGISQPQDVDEAIPEAAAFDGDQADSEGSQEVNRGSERGYDDFSDTENWEDPQDGDGGAIINCGVCDQQNESTAEGCFSCGTPLDDLNGAANGVNGVPNGFNDVE